MLHPDPRSGRGHLLSHAPLFKPMLSEPQYLRRPAATASNDWISLFSCSAGQWAIIARSLTRIKRQHCAGLYYCQYVDKTSYVKLDYTIAFDDSLSDCSYAVGLYDFVNDTVAIIFDPLNGWVSNWIVNCPLLSMIKKPSLEVASF